MRDGRRGGMKGCDDFREIDGFNLLVGPVVGGRLPVDNLLGLEPESNLSLGALDRVRAVDDVTAGLDAEVTTNATRLAVLRVGLAKHGTASLDGVQTRPDGGNHWARQHVVDQAREERSSGQILVVLLQESLGRL